MRILNYDIDINASAAAVWDTLVKAERYTQWAKAFSANSCFAGEWIEGGTVQFLDPEMGGTKARLDIVKPAEHLLLRHIAVISKAGEESTSGEIADKWLGTTEEYILVEDQDDKRTSNLAINISTHTDFVTMFDTAWPQALADIKRISEEHC